ncbi:MAG: acetyltransferase [Bacteroidetes bacterium]|jgi:putative acetyltransferase|nr:acetyltransferase [Bacteroidota bacterium]
MEIFRPIEKKDNRILADLIRKVFREYGIDRPGTVYTDPSTDHLFELFQTEGSYYWVAEDEGVILGGCGIYPSNGLPEGCCELVKFYLSKESRGKGIGKKLMTKSIISAKEAGYKEIYLESFPELAKAVTLYEEAGFKKLKSPMGNTGHFACNLWMIKEL